METLEEILATLPEGYGFCIRDDDEHGYMANVTTPDWTNDEGIIGRHFFPVFGGNLHAALKEAISLAVAARLN